MKSRQIKKVKDGSRQSDEESVHSYDGQSRSTYFNQNRRKSLTKLRREGEEKNEKNNVSKEEENEEIMINSFENIGEEASIPFSREEGDEFMNAADNESGAEVDSDASTEEDDEQEEAAFGIDEVYGGKSSRLSDHSQSLDDFRRAKNQVDEGSLSNQSKISNKVNRIEMTFEEYNDRQKSKSSSREMVNEKRSFSGANSVVANGDEPVFIDKYYENNLSKKENMSKTPAMAKSGKVSAGTFHNEGETNRVNTSTSARDGQSNKDVREGDSRGKRRTVSTSGSGASVARTTSTSAQIYRRVSVMLAQAAVERRWTALRRTSRLMGTLIG